MLNDADSSTFEKKKWIEVVILTIIIKQPVNDH